MNTGKKYNGICVDAEEREPLNAADMFNKTALATQADAPMYTLDELATMQTLVNLQTRATIQNMAAVSQLHVQHHNQWGGYGPQPGSRDVTTWALIALASLGLSTIMLIWLIVLSLVR
ncbi:MAG: hypothetical protein M9918_21420 [Anaerolineae bacterium]|nr:hypothetical protein [Anaerolineae bacterium]